MNEDQREAIIRAGYRAASDNCPYIRHSNEAILWYRGRMQHALDQDQIEAARKQPYCHSPLRIREWTSR